LLVFRNGLAEALRRLDDLEGVAAVHGDDALRLDVLLERGYTHWHTGDCPPGRRAYAEALALLERLRSDLGEAAYRAKRLAALRGSGLIAHNADDNAACLEFQTAALALAQETHDELEEVMARANRADAEWGCREYGRALRAYDEALADPAAFFRVRHVNVVGRGSVLGSIGRYEEAARLLAEGVDVCRRLGDAWLAVWGLVYLGAVRAGQGDLRAALDVSQEAVALAEQHGIGYPLVLARAHLLWQEEVQAPGHSEHAPRIEAALAEAQRLGLRGLALYLVWVRLLHRAADPGVTDAELAADLAAAVRLYRECAPVKGAWELLGLQVIGALRERRPGLDCAAVEALVEEEISAKTASLALDDQQEYQATRRRWEVAA
jgi:tetratricopeptide (TPR) repeat protein